MDNEINNHRGPLDDLASRPNIVGYFSVDEDGNYLPGSSRMMYFKPPTTENVQLDLNEGIEAAVRRDHNRHGHINNMLEWIRLNHADVQVAESRSWIEPKFVTSCGLLTTVMCMPYIPSKGWIICAAKWRGTIYMCHFERQEEKSSEIPAKFSSWGFKFEQYILSESATEAPDTSRPVIEGAEFRCVFQRSFGNHSVLFASEMDGLISAETLNDPLPLNDLRFVELKTQRQMDTPKQERNFKKYKLVRWWAQSFLVDNENILLGTRDDSGIVHDLTTYSLPEIVQMGRANWEPVNCVNSIRNFLDRVTDTVTDECDRTIYKFEKIPFKEGIIESTVSPNSEFAFMPDWYLNATG